VNFGSYRPDESQAFYEGKQDDESGKIRSAFRQGVDFSESFFKGKTLFSYAEFGGAKFCGAIFEGPVRFSKAKFNGRVDFSRAIFHSIVDFERAIFYPVPWLKQEEQGGNTPDMADFYNVSFKDDAYFSKSIFLIDANFKRTSFSQRLFLINTFFSRKAIFDGAILSNEMLGCQINDLGRIKREIAFYKVNKLKDDLNIQVKEEICAYLEKNFAECQTYSPTSSCPIPKDKDPKEIIEMWRGKEFYIGETSFAIIDQENFSCKNQFFSFIGTRFEGGVDFRNGQFNEVDFSSGEIMTIFRGAADLSDAFFGKIFMDGTVFLGKVYLPLENIFSESGMISRSVTIDDFFLKRGLRSENDHMQHRDEKKLRDLYTQLESIFRKNSQIFEANEMALRAAWLKLKLWDAQEKLSSLFILIALPIQNLLVFMLAVNLYFWFRLWAKNSIKARTSESSFRPCKLPLVYMSSEDLQNKGIERIKTPEGEKGIVRPRIWQAYSWPLFLCFGTFFAVLSLGSEYVTDDEGCLRKMKILRIGGFILLPLLLYSLAKRSEGLHPIATFM
jgi:uncharacterized protein YjbI with pentapeptide repeats